MIFQGALDNPKLNAFYIYRGPKTVIYLKSGLGQFSEGVRIRKFHIKSNKFVYQIYEQ